MKFWRLGLFCACMALATAHAAEFGKPKLSKLWRHRNLGAAHLANGDLEEARVQLEKAWRLSPDSPEDALNAGIGALRAGDLELAAEALNRAFELDPGSTQSVYSLGILAKRLGELEEAQSQLTHCLELGGDGAELRYNLGIVATRLGQSSAARSDFEKVVELGPDRAPRHYPSALYRYGRVLVQAGERDAGRRVLRDYQTLVKSGGGAELNEEQLELGDLMALHAFDRPQGVRTAKYLPAFALSELPGKGSLRWGALGDFDGDGDRDLIAGNGQTIRDLRRDGGTWVDVTASRGLAGVLGVVQAAVFDLDQDGTLDLVRGGGGGLTMHPGIEGGWDPPLPISAVPARAFHGFDFDHEGDVDFVSVGSDGSHLLRNNGDRSFTDVTDESGLRQVGPALTVSSGDLDDDLDVDLLFLGRRGELVLASNERSGKFRVMAAITPAPEGVFDLDLADLDMDRDLDIVVAAPSGVFVLENEGNFVFAWRDQPIVSARPFWASTPGSSSLWTGDFDNDGLLDVLIAGESGGTVAINLGGFSFDEETEPLRPLAEAGVRPVGVQLVDTDSRLDVLTSNWSFGLATNVGRIGKGLVLEPLGVKNNADGVGAVFELLAGTHYGRRDGRGGPVHFGTGGREVDALRVTWPNGIEQAVFDPDSRAPIPVEERAGLVGSCPFLYTWNGSEYEYITDILTVTPLGLPMQPGMYVPPDWDEAIRVTSDQLRPNASSELSIQVTEELREVTYLDQVRLYAIDHPRGTEVQPNEKFQFPPFPEFKVHSLDQAARRAVVARDHLNRDVTELLHDVDDLVVGDLELTPYQGIVERHTLELDFGDVPVDTPLMLHLAGWFYWTNASINIAISQNPNYAFIPPSIEVMGTDGKWTPWDVPVGFPGGKTKSIPVDLTGAFPNGRAHLRLSTTLRIYWDRALLQVGPASFEPRVTVQLPTHADLHYRGFSDPILSRTGEDPERFDYSRFRDAEPPWDQHPGLYTKYGDVTPLLLDAEDKYVIMASGDECTVSFSADAFPQLAEDQERTYFLVFDGWAKDGDPNTTHSGHVEPLPFHGMSGYPYGADEAYPDTEEYRQYRELWNTRPAVRLTRDFVEEARAAAQASEVP